MKPFPDHDLYVPVSLKKKQASTILIYGDSADRRLTKSLWNHVDGQEVRFVNVFHEKDLMEEARNSALIFVNIENADDARIELASRLSDMPEMVADVIAITAEPDIRKRLHIMSQEFDGIYNREILDLPEFHEMFGYKLKKGIRRLKARIQEDEYRTFRGYLSASADAFIVFDKEKRIFFVSSHYLDMYPMSRDYFVHGVPVQRAFEAVAAEMGWNKEDPRYIATKEFWIGQKGRHEFTLDNGRVLRMTAMPLPDMQGTIVSTTDITELTLQKQELAARRGEAELALREEQENSKLQKQFIGMVSHEFRTPLSIIDGNAQIIERRGAQLAPEEAKSRLKTIRSAVSRLVHMMEAVLSSNMLRTGRLDLEIERLDLKELIEELCEEQRGLTKDHTIICDVSGLPESVFLDKKVTTLVVTNLISNAVKYTRENPLIRVDAKIDQNSIFLTVADNGVGIPDDELANVFERFFRASTSSGVTGSGIGLSLVQELLQLHNGTIGIESAVGKGTVFKVRLPILNEESEYHV